ncbi:MAG TPA: glycosyltransferase family 4 protein [Nitrososphaera sp.]|nr:glycosyltransferase family 4 protein [Nitrososphaera sp.]
MAKKQDKICYTTGKKGIPRLLVFGYPLEAPPVGGLLWSKRVSDSISKLGVLDIKNISSERSIDAKLNSRRFLRNILPCLIMDFCDAVRGFLTFPQIALLDSWGEPSIFLWGLLRLFQPRTRIVVVFHHYEPRILPDRLSELKSHFTRAFANRYNSFIEKLTHKMINDSDMILTVSRTSAKQISYFYGVTREMHKINKGKAEENNSPLKSDKIRIVGTGVDRLTVDIDAQKDIDFFCIGRIEKLDGVDRIWTVLRKLRPDVNFVMIGRASLKEINHLKSLGINHKGEVSHQEKLNLYSRSKVFLFPSSREGFGIALAESLQLGMSAVIWKLPVFEELYLKSTMAKEGTLRLVEKGNYKLFASEAIEALELYDKRTTVTSAKQSLSTSYSNSSLGTVSSEGNKKAATISVLKLANEKHEENISEILQSWDDVAGKVVKVLSELN